MDNAESMFVENLETLSAISAESEALVPQVCGLDDAAELSALPSGPAEHPSLAVAIDGRIYDLGDPGVDPISGSVMEAVSLEDEQGMSIFTDTNGDGIVDEITTVRFDGSFDKWRCEVPQEGTAEQEILYIFDENSPAGASSGPLQMNAVSAQSTVAGTGSKWCRVDLGEL